MNSIDKKRYIWVIISAIIQGLLLGIYTITLSGPFKCVPLSVIFLVPFVFWLSQEHWGRRLFNLLFGLTAVLLIFWLYRLWSWYSPNGGNFDVVPSQKSDLIRVSMTVFLLIPFFQCRIASWSWKFPYSEIFFQFCRNLFLLFQSSIVIAVFWGLLVTAGLLFDIVGLDGVPFVIFNPLIAVPLSSLTIAISISVAIKHPGIDSLGRWILSVLAWLLPFFSVLSVMFLLYLPYSGLKTLWSTGQASTLMLLLQFGTLILTNAAWLDGSKPAFKSPVVNFLAKFSLLCLPFYFILCVYSVGIRIQQYGLSTDRIQAMFLVVVTGFWGLGYAGAILLRKWPLAIGKVNMASVLFMAAIVAAMNSPILDPARLSAFNQARRLQAKEISPDEFDYIYTRFHLGRYGNQVLEALAKDGSEEVKKGIEAAMAVNASEYATYLLNNIPPESIRREIISEAKILPEGSKLPEEYIEYFVEEWGGNSGTFQNVLNSSEIVFVFKSVERESGASNLILFTPNAGTVYKINNENFSIEPEFLGIINGIFEPNEVISQEITTSEPEFLDIKIGDETYQILK
ncbi:MAG: DUF4153 domain-containing protein [Synergistaceae bacterium]|nr:DUF4153 domain-containing protein [Synergistaceae bacterium]